MDEYTYLRLVVAASARGPRRQPTLHHAELQRVVVAGVGQRHAQMGHKISFGQDFAVLVAPEGFGNLDRSRGFAS